jgi:hypothetical protein
MTTTQTPRVFRPSYTSRLLKLECGGVQLGTATGFVVERSGGWHLVTNWHVVTGMNPSTGALLDHAGRRPDAVKISHLCASGSTDFVDRVEPLTKNGVPLWLEHPDHHEQVDVVALPITNLDDVRMSIYDPWRPPYVQMGVGDELTVVGFPFGISSDGLAVWTRGNIASEYDVDYSGLPRFLIDARTRPGQSGSPVIFFRTGAYFEKFGAIVVPAVSSECVPTPGKPIAPDQPRPQTGFTEEFLGVYSGRVHSDSDLGFVWRPSVIRDILERGVSRQTDTDAAAG